MEKFKMIATNSKGEITEKKSRFIANAYVINSKEEAEEKINEIKKKYYDAKHNCYASIVNNIEKCSDDGEPSGTAGSPILNVLKSNNLNNTLVVVTRYFGGILLGTGGLIRAYTEACKKALNNVEIVDKEYGIRYIVEISYDNLNNLEYLCKKIGINIIKLDYNVNIIATLESSLEKKEELDKKNVEFIRVVVQAENIVI